jgi:hypothetical protein
MGRFKRHKQENSKCDELVHLESDTSLLLQQVSQIASGFIHTQILVALPHT